jgi:hypothetical protein
MVKANSATSRIRRPEGSTGAATVLMDQLFQTARSVSRQQCSAWRTRVGSIGFAAGLPFKVTRSTARVGGQTADGTCPPSPPSILRAGAV